MRSLLSLPQWLIIIMLSIVSGLSFFVAGIMWRETEAKKEVEAVTVDETPPSLPIWLRVGDKEFQHANEP